MLYFFDFLFIIIAIIIIIISINIIICSIIISVRIIISTDVIILSTDNLMLYCRVVTYRSMWAETHVYHLPAPTENKLKTYMKH